MIQSVREIVGEQSYGIHEKTADEHLAILEAIRQGDADAAAAAMKAHLAQASGSAAKAAGLMRLLERE